MRSTHLLVVEVNDSGRDWSWPVVVGCRCKEGRGKKQRRKRNDRLECDTKMTGTGSNVSMRRDRQGGYRAGGAHRPFSPEYPSARVGGHRQNRSQISGLVFERWRNLAILGAVAQTMPSEVAKHLAKELVVRRCTTTNRCFCSLVGVALEREDRGSQKARAVSQPLTDTHTGQSTASTQKNRRNAADRVVERRR